MITFNLCRILEAMLVTMGTTIVAFVAAMTLGDCRRLPEQVNLIVTVYGLWLLQSICVSVCLALAAYCLETNESNLMQFLLLKLILDSAQQDITFIYGHNLFQHNNNWRFFVYR